MAEIRWYELVELKEIRFKRPRNNWFFCWFGQWCKLSLEWKNKSYSCVVNQVSFLIKSSIDEIPHFCPMIFHVSPPNPPTVTIFSLSVWWCVSWGGGFNFFFYLMIPRMHAYMITIL
jgi:hypothetical protein